ncbi:MAG: hypothetical protein ACLUOI_21110 [Eisenbergiella sp.]
MAENGMSGIDWEASWAESSTAMAIALVVAAVLALVVILALDAFGEKSRKRRNIMSAAIEIEHLTFLSGAGEPVLRALPCRSREGTFWRSLETAAAESPLSVKR